MHATWSRVGRPPEIPVTGQRNSIKILGAIELFQTRFHYRQDTVFNASTYLAVLEQLTRCYRRQGAILIQDNASYHKTETCGGGFERISPGWKSTNSRLTRRSRTPRNDCGNTRGEPEPTIDTSLSRRSWLAPSPASFMTCNATRS